MRVVSKLMPVRPDNPAIDKVDGLETVSTSSKQGITNQGNRVIARLFPDGGVFRVKAKLHPCPIAEFEASPLSGTEPLTVTFVNNSQFSDSYEWDFGDESAISTDENPTHEYYAGTYSPELTAINSECQDIFSRINYIVVTPGVCFWNDDFSVFDNAKWSPEIGSIVNGQLVVDGVYSNVETISLCTLSGNYSFKIDYSFNNVPDNGEISSKFSIILYNSDYGFFVEFGHFIRSGTDNFNRFEITGELGNSTYDTIKSSGYLKIIVSDDNISFYDENSLLTTLNDSFVVSALDKLKLSFLAYNNSSIAVDNFQFISGCPSSPAGCFWDDDFTYSSNQMDWDRWIKPTEWDLYYPYNYEIIDGKISFKDANLVLDLNTTTFSDFDVEVSVEFSSNVFYNGGLARLNFGDQYFVSKAYGWFSPEGDFTGYYHFGLAPGWPSIYDPFVVDAGEDGNPNIKLRLVKSGNNLSGYFDRGNGWELLGTIEITTGNDGTIGLFGSNFGDYIYFDNFKFNSGCP